MAILSNLLVSSSGLNLDNLVSQTGLSGASLNITAESLGIATSSEDGMFKEVTDGSRAPYSIPTITTITNRQNSWAYSWSSSDSWTNFYAYMAGNGKADAERAFWYGLGRNSKSLTLSYSNQEQSHIEYAVGSVVGVERQHGTYPGGTSYGPFRVRLMFLRNHHPTTAKSVTVWANHSSYWSSGYDGSGFQVGIPNASGSYAGVTDMNWTNLSSYQGSTSNRTVSGAFTIPAKTTVVVVLTNTLYYWTSSTEYFWWDSNKFYNLNGTFADPWIQPDLKMTRVAKSYNDIVDHNSTYYAHKIWNRTAELMGDR